MCLLIVRCAYDKNTLWLDPKYACVLECRIAMAFIPYSGKLSREKTFTNFAVLEPSAKVFSTKFGRAMPTYDRF